MERWTATIFCVLVVLAVCAGTAQADDLEDFDRARQAYEQGDYRGAVAQLERMVGGEVPRVRSPALLLESRKYLAASYLFLDRRADAEAQFVRLLRAEPNYVLDPAAFPAAVLSLFREVKERLVAEREAEARRVAEAAEAEREAEIARLIAERERLAQLEELARIETVERVNSRWVAVVPFGAGQFQNGDRRLGFFFLASEALTAGFSIGSFYAHQRLEGKDVTVTLGEDPSTENAVVQRAKAWRLVNWVSTSVFGALVVVGITDGLVRFEPVVRTTRERTLPPRPGSSAFEDDGPSASLRLGLGGAQLRVSF